MRWACGLIRDTNVQVDRLRAELSWVKRVIGSALVALAALFSSLAFGVDGDAQAPQSVDDAPSAVLVFASGDIDPFTD